MGFSTVEKAELTDYQLKDVAEVWFNQWKEERVVDVGPLVWNKFKRVFLDSFFPLYMREAKVLEFINLRSTLFNYEGGRLRYSQFQILRNWRVRRNLLTYWA
ncbi:hypothetical protein MTR67_040096 [Solanum verrucosum]|uniref:Retrotransposon gag domain-containing protein n=1 Tax=Solanum verrucosum TaxID=315347 RepID=A0AAF0ZPH0_SOLVR|nr:hypothetical protein MTR67_040096 [Solanum verrucosum]